MPLLVLLVVVSVAIVVVVLGARLPRRAGRRAAAPAGVVRSIDTARTRRTTTKSPADASPPTESTAIAPRLMAVASPAGASSERAPAGGSPRRIVEPRKVAVGTTANDAADQPAGVAVVYHEGTSGLVVAPALRLRHRIDELAVVAGLPVGATTLVIAVGDRQDRIGEPRRHGLVAFASSDRASSAFRSWFAIDGGAIPSISVDGLSSMSTVVDQVAKAVAIDATRAGPSVEPGQVLPRATAHLAGLARVIATDLASGGVFDVNHGLCDAIACVGIVSPVVDGSGRGAVQMVLVGVAEHMEPDASIIRDLAVTAVHEVIVDLRPELSRP